MFEDERIRQARPVEDAIDLGRENSFAILFGEIDDFKRDPGFKDLAIAPAIKHPLANRRPAPGYVGDGPSRRLRHTDAIAV